MHIVVGGPAMSIIRAIRCDRSMDSTMLLPAVDLPERNVELPDQWEGAKTLGKLKRAKGHAGASSQAAVAEDAYPHLLDETLETMGFEFGCTQVNKRVDLSSFGGVGRFTADRPLELGIFEERIRHTRKSVRARMLPRSLPARALVQVNADLWFAAPELAIVHMASSGDVVALACAIMELTGTYSLPPRQGVGIETRYSIAPVTTVARIRAVERCCPRIRNRKTLDQALALALEGSASPMETKLATILRTPMEQGGYGFPVASLNPQASVPAAMRGRLERDAYHPDIFIQDACVDIEYDSTTFHFDPMHVYAAQNQIQPLGEAIAKKLETDRRRMRHLQALGMRVVPVTSTDCATSDRLDNVAWAIAVERERTGVFPAQAYMDKLDEWENRIARAGLHARLLQVA